MDTMYKEKYHVEDLSKYKFLITGGAGFIGSNIVEYLLKYNAGHVRVLDNLSNGYYSNIEKFIELENFEFINGDIRDIETCKSAVQGIDFVMHQAALGSVPRSIENPKATDEVNIGGFLNMLIASRDSKHVKKFVYAASSSTYGDSQVLPKVEGQEGKPLSPYAITKLVNELYADNFSRFYGFHTIGLRYFNVFGPNQHPKNPYAAVIPIFCDKFMNKQSPTINGDGKTTRDFTFVENVVQANIKAIFTKELNKHEVFNVACGESISLNQMVEMLNELTGNSIEANYVPERVGDIKYSLADIKKIKKALDYRPMYLFKEGLKITYEWYTNNIK